MAGMFAHTVWGLEAVQPRPRGARAHVTATPTPTDAPAAAVTTGSGPKRDLYTDREARDNRLVRVRTFDGVPCHRITSRLTLPPMYLTPRHVSL